MQSLRVIRVVGEKRVESDLPAEQAQRLGIRNRPPRELSPIYLLDGLLAGVTQDHATEICSECGTTRREVILRRQVGCEHCYMAFGETIQRLLSAPKPNTESRTARSEGHSGRIPVRLQRYRRMLIDRRNLLERLEDAVAQEEFEHAADLRDQILRMETEPGQE
jgi:protein-arginine kinase activator protein McsA